MAFNNIKIIGDGIAQSAILNGVTSESVINSLIGYNTTGTAEEFILLIDGIEIARESISANNKYRLEDKINVPVGKELTVQAPTGVNITISYYNQAIDTSAALTAAQQAADDAYTAQLAAEGAVPSGAINDSVLALDSVWSSSKINDDNNLRTTFSDMSQDGIISGLTVNTSASLTSTITAGIGYIEGSRIVTIDTVKAFIASKNTYVDIDASGLFIYNETVIDVAQEDTINTITVANDTIYTLTINGTTTTYTSGASASSAEITAGLVSAINLLSEPVTATDGVDLFTILADVKGVAFTTVITAGVMTATTTIANATEPSAPAIIGTNQRLAKVTTDATTVASTIDMRLMQEFYNKTEVNTLTTTWSNIFTAVGAETIVTIPDSKEYVIGAGELIVIIEGVTQLLGIDYTEASTTTVEFNSALTEDEHVMFQKV